MSSTINRDYTSAEQHGLLLVVDMVEKAFQKFVPIVQTFKAGNNPHKFDLESRTVHIGKPEEPSFLHTPIIARGDPEAEYIPGIKLDGPAPGLNFDMMGKTANEPGNDRKINWSGEDMSKAAAYVRAQIQRGKEEYSANGVTFVTKELSANETDMIKYTTPKI